MTNPATPWKTIVVYSVLGTLVAVLTAWAILSQPLGFKQAFVPYEKAPTANIIALDYPDWELTDSDTKQHDGTQFYVMARSVFDMDEDGTNLDRPHYRWQRPLLAWLVAPGYWVGGPDGLVTAFFVVNVAAIFAGAVASGILSTRFGRGPVAAFWFPLLPGAYLSLKFGVADTLALSLFLVGYVNVMARRVPLAAALFALACLTKETTLVLVAGVALWEVLRGQPLRSVFTCLRARAKAAAALAAPAFLAVVLWGLYVRLTVPLAPDAIPQVGELTIPFKGMWETVRDIFTKESRSLVLFSWAIALAAAVLAFAQHRLRHPFSWPLLGSLLMLVVMNVNVIGFSSNTPRMLMAPTMLAILMVMTPPERYSEEHGTDDEDSRQNTTQPSS